jgi:hypothetical protein
MTQAFNLSQFANTLNASGRTSNSGLQNSSVTIATGTGLSGGGSVSLGASISLVNTGVTSLIAGSGITLSGSTGAVTITNNNLLTAGNGIGISSGSIFVNAPTAGSIGSYAFCRTNVAIASGASYGDFGGTYPGSSLRPVNLRFTFGASSGGFVANASSALLTGTWQCMNYGYNESAGAEFCLGIFVRVS